MRGFPIRNFICVLALLLVMAAGVAMTTQREEATQATIPPPPHSGKTVKVMVGMLFSHPPKMVELPGFRVNTNPTGNELDFTLTLPVGSLTELPLDIRWAERGNARYFTRITIRQDGREDDVVVFSDSFPEFSDTFTIDTRTEKP